MHREGIPDDVSRFILLAIPSVPYLEAILLLRSDQEQPWDYKQLSSRLYVNEKVAQSILADLHDQNLLALIAPEQHLYRFSPSSEELADMIARVADIYSKDLIGVTNLIHSKTSKKALQFADAFIWRKDV
jgi:Mn-dependent DtxR family transcriptional regulator